MKTLHTDRLTLRRLELSDASEVQRLAGDWKVAEMTAAIPHPYPDGLAEEWIQSTHRDAEEGKGYLFVVVRTEDQQLLGCMGLMMKEEEDLAALGYWIGTPYWGKGYATEAACRVVQFGFEDLNLYRIFAYVLTRNPGSMRVLKKLGFTQEGILREHHVRWGKREDLACMGLLVREWREQKQNHKV
jgi:[ribosomal protein S5]-alanine N-acetyltransferase